MRQKNLIILGTGGGTRELLSLIAHTRSLRDETAPWHVAGILDDNIELYGRSVCGISVVGTLADANNFSNTCFINGIASSANPRLRLDIVKRMNLAPECWATFVHPQAIIVDSAQVGPGAIVYPGAVISSDAHLGSHGLAYYGAVVHHDTTIGDGSILCAGVCVAGYVTIGQGCYLGIGCVVRDHIRIGDGAFVGMGAVVTKDVSPGEMVVGVPARPLRRLGDSEYHADNG